MLMKNSLKSVSINQVEEAFAKALKELTGNTSSVDISVIQFESSVLTDDWFTPEVEIEKVSLSLNATIQELMKEDHDG